MAAQPRSDPRASRAAPRRRARPTSCTLSGRPSAPNPAGSEIAGCPVRLNTGYHGMKRPAFSSASGADCPYPPSAAIAVVARPGVSSTSHSFQSLVMRAIVCGRLASRRVAAARGYEPAADRRELPGGALGQLRAPERLELLVSAAQVALDELERHRPVARDRARSPRGRARSAAAPSGRTPGAGRRRAGRTSRAAAWRETAIRSGAAGGVWAASRNVPRGGAIAVPSPGAEPWITSSSSALSATVRASAPKVASPSQPSPSGCDETRPRVGFMPTSPQQAAGIRIEPPPSDAPAAGTRPAATAAAEPPDEPPGVRDEIPRVAGHPARVAGRPREQHQLGHACDPDRDRAGQPQSPAAARHPAVAAVRGIWTRASSRARQRACRP